MNPITRNLLGFIAGLVVGMAANIFFINISGKVIALPEGVDPNNFEALKASIAKGDFEFKHYIMPFIAHASQALLGAFICTKIAASYQKILSLVLGVLGLAGGIGAAYMLCTPPMATTVDLIFAYFPMAWIGWKMGMKGKS